VQNGRRIESWKQLSYQTAPSLSDSGSLLDAQLGCIARECGAFGLGRTRSCFRRATGRYDSTTAQTGPRFRRLSSFTSASSGWSDWHRIRSCDGAPL
jgi:hypothetical protein